MFDLNWLTFKLSKSSLKTVDQFSFYGWDDILRSVHVVYFKSGYFH